MDVKHADLLDSEAISRAEALGLHARYVVEGYMSGEHKSPYRGFAVEFAQHREYTHGDDTRHIDWKVEARTDRLFVKQYEQETNYVANVLLDGSESMMYASGSHTKLQYGKMIAAVLSFIILHQRDAVALGIFDDDMKDYAPRSDSKASLNDIMSRLAAFKGSEETDIATTLHNMAVQTPRRGIFVIISDFFDDDFGVYGLVVFIESAQVTVIVDVTDERNGDGFFLFTEIRDLELPDQMIEYGEKYSFEKETEKNITE